MCGDPQRGHRLPEGRGQHPEGPGHRGPQRSDPVSEQDCRQPSKGQRRHREHFRVIVRPFQDSEILTILTGYGIIFFVGFHHFSVENTRKT